MSSGFINPASGGLLRGNNLSEIAAAGAGAQAAARANLGVAIGTGDLVATNNLSDVASIATARNNLDVYSKAESQSLVVNRAIAAMLYADGSTSGVRAQAKISIAGNLSAKSKTILGRVYFPTSAEISGKSWAIFNLCPDPNVAVGTSGDGLALLFNTSGTNLFVRQYGPTAADVKRWNSNNPSYSIASGRVAPVAIVMVPGSAPVVYVDGVSIAGTNPGDLGAPNPWGTHSCDYFTVFGRGGSTNAFGSSFDQNVIAGELTAAEILNWAITGRLPMWCAIGTGSANDIAVNGTFAIDPTTGPGGSWVLDAGVIWDSVNAWVNFATAGTAYLRSANSSLSPMWHKPGWKYRIRFTILNYVSGTMNVTDGAGNVLTPTNGIANAFSANGTYELEFISSGGTAQVAFRTNGAGTMSLDTVQMWQLGPLAKWEIQPGGWTCTDSGENGIPLLLTPGMSALGFKPAEITIRGNSQTSDGFILADQVITPSGYELIAAYVLQTGTATSTITVKETSSGGTTVATGALSATAARVALAVSNGLLAENKKLHLANSAWGGNTVTPFFVFRRAN